MGLGICGWATSRGVGAWAYDPGGTEARGPLNRPGVVREAHCADWAPGSGNRAGRKESNSFVPGRPYVAPPRISHRAGSVEDLIGWFHASSG